MARQETRPKSLPKSETLERVTREIVNLRNLPGPDMVRDAVELGGRLLEMKSVLTGQYLRWLKSAGISPKAACNYERIAKLAQLRPELMDEWRELGRSKLYRVAALTPKEIDAVLLSSHRTKLVEMSDREFAKVTAPYTALRRRGRGAGIDTRRLVKRLKDFRETLQALAPESLSSARERDALGAELAALASAAAAAARRLDTPETAR